MNDEQPNSRPLVVSPLASVTWREGRIELSAAGAPVDLATDDLDVLGVLHAFRRPRPLAEVVARLVEERASDVAACVDDLLDAEVLIEADAVDPAGWDHDALAFHRRSRADRPPVRTGVLPPAVAPPRAGLATPLGRHVVGSRRDLAEVLEARRSSRSWPVAPITFEELSGFLWLSARNRPSGHLGDGVVSRPYPSGGAAYSLELYPVLAADAVAGVAAGVYRYRPEDHSLETVSTDVDHVQPFLDAAAAAAGSERPPVVVVVTSRFARQSTTYGHLAYSLVLKEVGGLFQTVYLVAEYLDLALCALGGGMPDHLLYQLLGTDELTEPVVGELMLGPRHPLDGGGRDG